MFKRLVLAATIATFAAGAALAQDKPIPTNQDACLQIAFDLAQSAENKNLSDVKLEKLEALLSTMEGHCDKEEFAEAMTVSKDIEAEIGQ